MEKVIIGGTFDIFHKGHEALLKRAFELGKVKIGLTSDKFAKEFKKREVTSFEKRKRNLEILVKEKFFQKPEIVEINDIYGPTLKEDFDFIVVSEETFKNALKINQKRKYLGKKPIKIVKIKTVLAEDGKPISCKRIKNGEIDSQGRECLFCKIVKGKIGALKIFEDKNFLAFLDKNPRNPGHTLVIPKNHFRYLWDIPYIDKFFKFAQKIAKALQKAMKTSWIIAPVLGDEVWHAHLHLIPRFEGDNFYYLPPKVRKISEKEMKKIQKRIKRASKS